MNGNASKRFRSIIIGNGSLSIRCAETLLKQHEIAAIVSSDTDVVRWAKANHIRNFSSIDGLLRDHDESVDYLFSINNEHILSDNILRLANRCAINYHDAPLPRYAGTHATSWALINGEQTHGITWHIIEDKVDAGDILVQRVVDISPDETALSLNMKCYEAGIEAFEDLIEKLEKQGIQPTRQDLTQRTFFPRYKQLKNSGVISWSQPANVTVRLIRALDFGSYPNALGKAKVVIGDEAFVVDGADVCGASSRPPGTIVQLGDNGLQVASLDKDVLISKFSTLDGTSLSASEIVQRFDLREGYRFSEIPDSTSDRIAEILKVTSKDENYWVDKLSNLNLAPIPYSLKAPVAKAAEYRTLPVRVPDEFSASLDRTFGESCLQTSLLASFGVLISRLTGIRKFALGYSRTDSTRQTSGLGHLFAGAVPICFEIDDHEPLSILCDHLTEELNQTLARSTFLRDIVVRYPALSATTDSATLSFPSVIFADINRSEDFSPPSGSDLILACSGRDVYWIYNVNRLDEEGIKDLSTNFVSLLESFAKSPTTKTGFLALTPDAKREQLLSAGRGLSTEYPREKCIHQLFEQRVKRSPNSIAIFSDSGRLSYGELNSKANSLAHHLISSGIKIGDVVGLALERSAEFVIGILAVLKAGGTYVPVDPAYPPERLGHIGKNAGVKIVLSQERLAGRLRKHFSDIICFDTDWPRIADQPNSDPDLAISSKMPAYILYTSGSTGRPKGVLVSHRSLVNHAAAMAQFFALESKDRILQFSSFNFDVAAEELFPSLFRGCGVVLLQENDRSSLNRFSEFICRHEITVVNLPTSYWRQWTSALASTKGTFPKSVRLLIVGSECVFSEDYNSWRTIAGTSVRWINAYGLTETTITSLVFEPARRDAVLETIPIGKPIDNAEVYLLDKNMQPMPKGIPGRLYIGGDCVANGYLNLSELTSERFISNPYDLNGGSILYDTGDLGRLLPDGNIEFLGRDDDQVKVRGFRVELGEIESVLSSHPKLGEVAVVAASGESGETSLTAYFVRRNERVDSNRQSFHKRMFSARQHEDGLTDSTISTTELRDYLADHLPSYMIPSTFIELEQMPLTFNGKVDRKSLRATRRDLSSKRNGYAAPRNDTERILAGIWGDLLGIDEIGIHDNFFDLGGQSLLAIRMFTRVEETFRKSIPLATLFEAGTIAALAHILSQDNWQEPESAVVPIQPKGSKPPLFCIHAKGGNVLFYRDLARHLGEDQPFYAIQARRLGGRQVGHSTVEEMAEDYIREIKSIQPVGPYFVGGASFGGLAAFEIAQQLHRKGEKVALLALLDTGTPDYPKMLPGTSLVRSYFYSFKRRMQLHLETLQALSNRERFGYVKHKLAKVKLKYRRKLINEYKGVIRNYYSRSKRDAAIPANYIQLEDQISKAGQKYVPLNFPGKLTLFRASNQPFGIEVDPTLGWGPFVSGKLEIHEIAGHHGSIISEPYVGNLAEKLAACIRESSIENNIGTKEDGAGGPPSKRSTTLPTGVRGKLMGALLPLFFQVQFICVELAEFLAGRALPTV